MTSCCCADWIGGLARTHAGQLASIARREGASAADALDVVQDAFQRMLSRPDLRADPDAAARTLAAMVRNGARNLRRRHHHARPHDDIELSSDTPSPIDQLEHATTIAQLEGCMAALGDTHRHVVTLRVLEELSGDEAARELGVTPGHVAVLLHRARKQLERCMVG
ncbi:MAG TPA: sigma-70 family RNA polymerase sigma factor [Kofleriaceae bacterium]|jgi:RNA polymerase sigma-70 factor (ECF subfamily)|nr:sigma-70 family RNA polymerase sigma factor [Kofleriaceae bacterium]